ncbi:hypothetical protein JOM56_005661 [Amanita muscaria]
MDHTSTAERRRQLPPDAEDRVIREARKEGSHLMRFNRNTTIFCGVVTGILSGYYFTKTPLLRNYAQNKSGRQLKEIKSEQALFLVTSEFDKLGTLLLTGPVMPFLAVFSQVNRTKLRQVQNILERRVDAGLGNNEVIANKRHNPYSCVVQPRAITVLMKCGTVLMLILSLFIAITSHDKVDKMASQATSPRRKAIACAILNSHHEGLGVAVQPIWVHAILLIAKLVSRARPNLTISPTIPNYELQQASDKSYIGARKKIEGITLSHAKSANSIHYGNKVWPQCIHWCMYSSVGNGIFPIHTDSLCTGKFQAVCDMEVAGSRRPARCATATSVNIDFSLYRDKRVNIQDGYTK